MLHFTIISFLSIYTLLTIFNLYNFYLYIFYKETSRLGITEYPSSRKRITNAIPRTFSTLGALSLITPMTPLIAIAMDISLEVSIYDTVNVYLLPSLALIVLTLMCAIVLDAVGESDKLLIKFSLKHTDLPLSVIQFALDNDKLTRRGQAESKFELSTPIENKDLFERLKNSGSKIKPDAFKPITVESEFTTIVFPIYTYLNEFSLKLYSVPHAYSTPIITAYIVDNIALLSTIITILKEDVLIETLTNPLGFDELLSLSEKCETLNDGLQEIVDYVLNVKNKYILL